VHRRKEINLIFHSNVTHFFCAINENGYQYQSMEDSLGEIKNNRQEIMAGICSENKHMYHVA